MLLCYSDFYVILCLESFKNLSLLRDDYQQLQPLRDNKLKFFFNNLRSLIDKFTPNTNDVFIAPNQALTKFMLIFRTVNVQLKATSTRSRLYFKSN